MLLESVRLPLSVSVTFGVVFSTRVTVKLLFCAVPSQSIGDLNIFND